MSDDFEAYEQACKKIRESNEKLLSQFEDWLLKKNLVPKTVDKHIGNIDFYINEFLLYEDALQPEQGAHSVDMFLGYWFIKKAMWASESSIKSNAASLKKFYTFMQEIGRIDEEDLEDLKTTIKDNMNDWIATLRRYDDPSITNMADVWGL
ncbi:recombinase [candidate division KSB1 bacterium]|nr:recombinase [candidate division KSB1 bacterium]NIR71444.1 recombinase [candidate division KSB1 bacterium]NIS23365.1 recombinase [candidate division KSB1 bacterium]NIT70256.1 recombinase [candidate division KSB1 bacterium]NIU23979.1 recombinase [candidate division KSB1 bacterium]